MALHAFVDESQGPPYRMAVVLVETADLRRVRAEVRRWRHAGAPRFHASRDGNRVRTAAMRSLQTLPVALVVVELARDAPSRGRRSVVVGTVARLTAERGVARLVFEDAEPERDRDALTVRRALGGAGRVVPRFEHAPPSGEPILWIADLVAWAFARGGKWRSRLPEIEVRKAR